MFCPNCGVQNAEDVRFCGACGVQIAAQSYPSAAAQSTPARMGDRFLAIALDTILFAGIFAVVGMAIARRLGGITEQGFSFEGRPALLTIGLTLLLMLLYFWLCEGLFGATLGKGIIGIRVSKADGGACGLGPSLARNLLRLIDGIAVYLVGFIVALLSKRRQRIGDHLAGTIVVESKPGAAARAGLIVSWLLLLGGGFAGAYMLHRGAPVTQTASAGGDAAQESGPVEPAATGHASMTFSSTGALKVVNFDCLQSEGGSPRQAAPYVPGDTVYLKYDVIGYSTDSEGRARLQYDISAFDPNGVLLHTPWKNTYTGRLDRGTPVNGTFNLGIPRPVPDGASRIVIQVRDEISSDQLQLTFPFWVDAAPIAPATTLEIRDFEIAASETGPAEPALELQGGGTVHMRCKVFGPQFRGEQADVQMSLKLIGPGGRAVFEKADYGSINDTWTYHPATFHVPVTGHLSLPGGTPKGSYRAVYTFTDRVSGRSVVKEGRFDVK